jgi:AraC family transcriptional regulator of arabinose operon
MQERIQDGFLNQRISIIPREVVNYSKEQPLIKNCYITDVGHFPPARHHYIDRPKGRDEYVLIFCTGGNGWCDINGQLWNIREGNILIIPAGTPHSYGAHEVAPWTIYWSHFAGDGATQLIAKLGVKPEQPLFETDDIIRISECFESMLGDIQNINSPGDYPYEILLLLSASQTLILSILLASRKFSDSSGKHIEKRVFQSISYMKANITQTFTLEQLANNVNMSSSHYSALFKRQIHNSPIAFFNNLKMQRACELFSTNQHNISRVANQLGFEDSYYFSRIFKKIVGTSPSEYLKRLG